MVLKSCLENKGIILSQLFKAIKPYCGTEVANDKRKEEPYLLKEDECFNYVLLENP